MTHEIRVLVTLQVQESDEQTTAALEDMQEAAVEAVENAVKAAYEMGFSHSLADKLCIGLVDAVLYEEE
ncbi:MAG: hypothetical protein GXY83_20855 [Rhodopirellula sp.]|nr:hypothetical protein [Rhodopirellula sp.]